MKRLISILLIFVLIFCTMTGCSQKEHSLRGLVSTQNMITQLSRGNLEEAWNPIYESMVDPELKAKLEDYVSLLGGREIVRCDCVSYNVTGDKTGPGNYEETTQYEIILDDETKLYAQAICIRDENGEGIIDLGLYEKSPW